MTSTVDPPQAFSDAPQLLDGTELLGQAEASGLREPPYLVRRRDGQVVQLSRVLYAIAARMDGRSLGAIAAGAGSVVDRRIAPEQVAYVAEHKLAPLGLVRLPDGREPILQPADALLALRFRAGVLSGRRVNAIARMLQPLYRAPIVIAAVVALVAFDLWLVTGHGIGAGLNEVIGHPTVGLALLALVVLSLIFHELGHATACRFGGARPGRIGVGIYLLWPAFFSDVTDSYRLNRAGRLRTDLGGMYFNVLFALASAGAYLATQYEPLIVLVVMQQMIVVDQFIPWVRLDGYHVISDLIGVSDLFARIKPVLSSLLPGRQPDARVTALKPWARAAVTTWVLTTLAVLSAAAVLIVTHAPGYLRHAWASLFTQLDAIGGGMRAGGVAEVLLGATSTIMLLLPVAGLTLSYLLLCRRLGTAAALRRVRTDPTLAAIPAERARQGYAVASSA
jgi:putative peptide zinc metalloprotease protein